MICTAVGAYGIRPELRGLCNVSTAVCNAVWAAAYRVYAIRPYKWRKSKIDYLFHNIPKTTSDIRKTMSYAGKIISDIIKTTSDLFFAPCNILKNKSLQKQVVCDKIMIIRMLWKTRPTAFCLVWVNVTLFTPI